MPLVSPKNRLLQLFAWYGVVAILCGYALISFGYIEARGYVYQGLMVTGSLGIVLEALHKRDYQPAVLNLVFASIGVVAILVLLVS